MTSITPPEPRRLPSLTPLLWAALAVITGWMIATLPPAMSTALLGGAAALLAATITPLAALAALLILAPLRTLIATESALQLPLDIGQLILLGTLCFWAIYRISRREPLLQFEWSPVFAPVLIFTAAAGATVFSTLSLSTWLSEWLKWVQIIVLMIVVIHLGRGGRWQWILFGLILAGIANGLIGLYEYFGGSGALHLHIGGGRFRAFGTFGQPNPFGGFMGLLAPLATTAAAGYAVQAWGRWRHNKRILMGDIAPMLYYALAAAIIIVGILISWSRGAWLGFGVSMFAVVFAFPRKLWHSLALVAVIGSLGAALWMTGRLPASIVSRINSATEELFAFDDVRGVDITPENYAVVERLAHWQAALNMARANPLLGVGMGNYEIAYPAYRLINWKFPLGHAHNYYLNVFAEAGIIGLSCYVAQWLIVMFWTWRARQHPNTLARFVALGLFGTWTYLAVHSLTDNLYVNNLFLHIGVMLGILAVLVNQSNTMSRLRTS